MGEQCVARIAGFHPGDLLGTRVEDVVTDPESLAFSFNEGDYMCSTGKPLFHRSTAGLVTNQATTA